MNWTILIHSVTETGVLLLFSIILFFTIYRLQYGLLKQSNASFAWNEAASIYTGSTFIVLALLLQSGFLTLQSALSLYGLEDTFLLAQGAFYFLLFKLGALLLMVVVLLLIGVFLFTWLITEMNIFYNISHNKRGSAMMLGAFQIALTYALSNQIDLIFSSIFSTTNHATIF